MSNVQQMTLHEPLDNLPPREAHASKWTKPNGWVFIPHVFVTFTTDFPCKLDALKSENSLALGFRYNSLACSCGLQYRVTHCYKLECHLLPTRRLKVGGPMNSKHQLHQFVLLLYGWVTIWSYVRCYTPFQLTIIILH